MAEKENGVIEGALGAGEAEEREAEESSSRADDVATVVMMDAARFDPELSKEAKEYLRKQGRLVDLQVHHFDEERKLSIEAAKRKRFFDHLRMSFQVFMVMVAASIGLGAILMIWDAVHSNSVVIDPIEISSNIASQVPNGRIISAGLLDVLSHIQAASRTNSKQRQLSNAWTNDIAIEVPETGMSIGQIERTLKARFGHDQHIDGDVVPTSKGGLALTVRGDGIPAKTFIDEDRDLDKLLTEAGEYIFGQSQPGIFGAYLNNAGRNADAINFAQAAYPIADASEKPYLLNSWALAIGSADDPDAIRQSLRLFRETIKLKPDFWVGYENVMSSLQLLGDEEGAIQIGERLKQVSGGRPGRAPELRYQNYDQAVQDLTALHSEFIADSESHGGIGTGSNVYGSASLVVAQWDAFLHDIESAQLVLQTSIVDPKNMADSAVAVFAKAILAEEEGDLKAAARNWDAYTIEYANHAISTFNPANICFAARTYEMTGQHDKADEAIAAPMKATGHSTYVDCYRFKADLLELRGDWVGATEWYSKAVNLSPSTPSGYFSFGVALVKHGDLNGAAEQFKLANLKGPHWADPLKAWGDVLMKQGHASEALDKYDAAIKYAPNWKQLKEARAVAMKA